jgi:hypothetical protein
VRPRLRRADYQTQVWKTRKRVLLQTGRTMSD